MNARNTLVLVLAIFAAIGLVLYFGAGAMSGHMIGGGSTGNGWMDGVGALVLPVLLGVALIALLTWFVKGND